MGGVSTLRKKCPRMAQSPGKGNHYMQRLEEPVWELMLIFETSGGDENPSSRNRVHDAVRTACKSSSSDQHPTPSHDMEHHCAALYRGESPHQIPTEAAASSPSYELGPRHQGSHPYYSQGLHMKLLDLRQQG